MVVALLSAPIGSGKTTAIQTLVRAAGARGSKVVVAVPTLQLAREWTSNLSDLKVHNLASFKNYFNSFEEFKCPNEAEITRDLDCAETQNNIRRRYCKSCPFVGECGYANQYNEHKLKQADVIIMQHSHLTSRKTREAISKIHADMLVIDEDCLESVLEHVEFPSNLVNEIQGLIDVGFSELEPLLEWQRKLGRPSGKLKIPRKKVLLLRDHLFNEGRADTLAQLLQLRRCYEENEDLTLDGIVRFNPPPRFPVTVVADATAVPEVIQLVFNQAPKIFGGDCIHDYRAEHPDNKVFMVVDSALSKTQLTKDEDELFYEHLSAIGRIVARRYKAEQILVTVFQNMEIRTRDYFDQVYPGLTGRITINHLEAGTNKYEHFDVQFLLCATFMHDRDIKTQVWKLKTIANHYRRLNGKLLENPSPAEQPDVPVKKDCLPVRLIHARTKHEARVYEYEKLRGMPMPTDRYALMAVQLRLSKTQQGLRLRYKDKQRTTFIMGYVPLRSAMVSNAILLEDLGIRLDSD